MNVDLNEKIAVGGGAGVLTIIPVLDGTQGPVALVRNKARSGDAKKSYQVGIGGATGSSSYIETVTNENHEEYMGQIEFNLDGFVKTHNQEAIIGHEASGENWRYITAVNVSKPMTMEELTKKLNIINQHNKALWPIGHFFIMDLQRESRHIAATAGKPAALSLDAVKKEKIQKAKQLLNDYNQMESQLSPEFKLPAYVKTELENIANAKAGNLLEGPDGLENSNTRARHFKAFADSTGQFATYKGNGYALGDLSEAGETGFCYLAEITKAENMPDPWEDGKTRTEAQFTVHLPNGNGGFAANGAPTTSSWNNDATVSNLCDHKMEVIATVTAVTAKFQSEKTQSNVIANAFNNNNNNGNNNNINNANLNQVKFTM